MEEHKPIGPHGWLAVEKGYNKWARINNSIEHDQTSFQRKWDAVCFKIAIIYIILTIYYV